ncbi:2-thiouracil desulfurase family protein [Vibrio sp.]|nr:2-thiouracil desulfurase family protein [Vibrio sp.]
MASKALVGISSCLEGQKVRFDAGHKNSRFITQELSPYIELKTICPEVAIGLGVPRPTIRLISDEERVRLVDSKDSTIDHTDKMVAYSKGVAQSLSQQPICGYVVCANSPTCGMERVKVYGNNRAEKSGVGLHTQELIDAMPWLPIEEDGRLNDAVLRENFVTRVFCLQDFYETFADEPTPKKVVEFHSRYKLMLMAHHPETYRELGPLVANLKDMDMEAFLTLYREKLMFALKHRASRKNNTNTLMHLQGYFKKALDKKRKAELSQVIDNYRIGNVPLFAPLTLINHYLHVYPDAYLEQQKYLTPYPDDLRLRVPL